jgi:hypothetical protein
MNAKMLRAILENVHDDVDIWVTVNGYDEEVGGFYFNEDQGYIALAMREEEDDTDDTADDTLAPGDDNGYPSSCALPEGDPKRVGIRDL